MVEAVAWVQVRFPVPAMRLSADTAKWLATFQAEATQTQAALAAVASAWASPHRNLAGKTAAFVDECESRIGDLRQKRLRVARGFDLIAVRIDRLLGKVLAHYGGVSATADLYVQALQGDDDALQLLWDEQFDDALLIHELRQLLTDLHELAVEAAQLWELLPSELPTAERPIEPADDPPQLSPLLILIGSVETNAPPVAPTDVNPFQGHAVGFAA